MDEHLCPQKDCGEVLSRNKKGDFPQFCPECNGPTGLGKDPRIYCPDPECGELLKKNKKGVYPKHCPECNGLTARSEEHTSELQSRETISYAVFCLKKKTKIQQYARLP